MPVRYAWLLEFKSIQTVPMETGNSLQLMLVQLYQDSFINPRTIPNPLITVPGGQHLGVQVGSGPAFPHFSHLGSGRRQQLVDLPDADAKVSRRQLRGVAHDQHVLALQLPVGVLDAAAATGGKGKATEIIHGVLRRTSKRGKEPDGGGEQTDLLWGDVALFLHPVVVHEDVRLRGGSRGAVHHVWQQLPDL